MPTSDEELLLTYRKTGDRELYAQLVYRYERELFSYLRRYLGNAEMAEDVFQTAFLAVHLKADKFEEGRRFRPWLYSIATNAAIDSQRRNKKHAKLSLDTPQENEGDDMVRWINLLVTDELGPEGSVLREEQIKLVRYSLSKLPEAMIALIQMVYFQGMKYKEAAEVLGIPVGTVKSRLNAAIHRLTDMWKASYAD